MKVDQELNAGFVPRCKSCCGFYPLSVFYAEFYVLSMGSSSGDIFLLLVVS